MTRSLLPALSLILCLLSNIPLRAQTIYYVKQDGAGTGTSWDDASRDLQLMINQAAADGGGQVWVATGKYFPVRNAETMETGELSQDHAFVLQPRVQVYGSFTGTESSPAERPPRTVDNASQLNGGLTCNHVVISAGDVEDALLDGFEITGGRRTTAGLVGDHIIVNRQEIPRTYGGGIVAVSSSPTLRNLRIADNHTYMAGGGIALSYSKSHIENVELTGNSVIGVGGAGILIAVYPNPAGNSLHIRSATPFTGYRLLDATGRVVVQEDVLQSYSKMIDFKRIATGVYMLQLSLEDGTRVTKTVVKKE